MPLPTEPPPDAVAPERHPDAAQPGTDLGEHYADCFGCGGAVAGGLRLRFTAGEAVSVHAVFEVTKVHQGAPGLAHGGVVAAVFDEALGTACSLVGEPAVTARLETDFRRPVPVGSTLHVHAIVDKRAGRKLYLSARGRLDSPDGPVAATARAMFLVVGVEHFVEHGTLQVPGIELNP